MFVFSPITHFSNEQIFLNVKSKLKVYLKVASRLTISTTLNLINLGEGTMFTQNTDWELGGHQNPWVCFSYYIAKLKFRKNAQEAHFSSSPKNLNEKRAQSGM